MRTVAAMLVLTMASPVDACGELAVQVAWIRTAPPGAKVMAGYATFHNPHEQSVLIQGASAAGFDAVELHSMTVDENGVMKMRELDMIEVKVGQSQSLTPGGNHLMLIGPDKTYAPGDTINVALKLCEEKQQVVRFVVADGASAVHSPEAHDHEHGHH